jgi:hypothetical protein
MLPPGEFKIWVSSFAAFSSRVDDHPFIIPDNAENIKIKQ